MMVICGETQVHVVKANKAKDNFQNLQTDELSRVYLF